VRRMSKREHLLLVAAVAAAAITTFHHLRLRPAREKLALLSAETGRYAERLAEARWPRPPEDPKRLAARRDAVRREVEAARQTLFAVERRFVSRGDPSLADDLRLKISALADHHRVHVRENLPFARQSVRGFVGETRSDAAAAARFVRFLTLGEPYTLRVRQVVLEADFAGLRGFLHDLAGLEHHVLVLRFDVTAGPAAYAGVRTLSAKLLLVL